MAASGKERPVEGQATGSSESQGSVDGISIICIGKMTGRSLDDSPIPPAASSAIPASPVNMETGMHSYLPAGCAEFHDFCPPTGRAWPIG